MTYAARPPTTRTLTAPITGPVVLDLTMPSGLINVTVTGIDRAEITLATGAPAGSPAAQAVDAAAMSINTRVMTVHVPTPDDDEAGTCTVTSVIVISGGTVRISGAAADDAVTGAIGSGVYAEVRLPPGSALRVDTESGEVVTAGELEWIDFASDSGDLEAEACGKLTASTTSGDVSAEVADRVMVRTVSGDVWLGRTEAAVVSSTSGDLDIDDFGGSAQLTTVSGDITVAATESGHLIASSVSGDITVTAPEDLVASRALTVQAHSVSGDVRTPRPRTARHRRRRRVFRP
ncbi:MAG: DUF4097 family beta strand repeat-containing protein [Actinomycetes bacterium]|jgi:hypothetical protein